MAITINKDSFKSDSNESISFGDIAARYGKRALNVKASDYLRDDSDLGTDTTKPVKNATENSAVPTTTDNWSVGDLKNTITSYVVTHTNRTEEFDATSNVDWNDNLNKNILKTFNLNNGSEFYSDEVGKYPLSFDADMRNLTISIAGDIYGASGAAGNANEDGGDGGDALYVRNTYTKDSNVKIQINANGRILPGGGGGGGGGNGANKTLACDSYENVSFQAVTYEIEDGNARSISIQRESYGKWGEHCTGNAPTGWGNRPAFRTNGTPNVVNYVIANAGIGYRTRKRCRGSRYRRSDSGYTCYARWNVTCRGTFPDTKTATGGNGAAGGRGVGYINPNISLISPLSGSSGNNGNTANCINRGTSVTGGRGGDGGDGGSYGQAGKPGDAGGDGGAGGKSILYKNVNIIGKNDTTVKGSISQLP